MKSPNVLIHIGYPKSGSSTLQECVLSKHSGVRYLAGHTLESELDKRPLDLERVRTFYNSIIHDQNPDMSYLQSTWEEVFLTLCDHDKLNVISDERFVMNYRSPAEIAKTLRKVIGPAKILIVARDQVGLLRSQYDMSPFYERDPNRKYLPFKPWLEKMLAQADENMASSLRYKKIVDLYASLFGEENIIVAAFEGLFTCPLLQANLAAALVLEPAEFSHLLRSSKTGDASSHGYKKITRRILGARTASSYLKPKQLQLARWVLRKLFPGRKTQVDSDCVALIRAFYKGHQLSDLALQPGAITVVKALD